MSDLVDMRPSLGQILRTYQNYSYKPETAIAEFVDNSVESYRQNKAMLELLYGSDFQLQIIITYNPLEETLKIIDNAYGMTHEVFQDALKIAKPPKNTNGRNEYGMGLKTAASWFGSYWTVTTICPDENVQYKAVVDVDELIRTETNTIEIQSDTHDQGLGEHGTIVSIKVGKRHKITDRSFENLIKELTSLYRRDISDNKIRIEVRNHVLSYVPPVIRKREIDGKEEELKKEFDEVINHDGTAYRIKGFVAIRETGSHDDAGFVLFRRGRVIIGGSGKNYRPKHIFGSSNSFEYQRLFGEIDLDEFPVTQAKDAFDWDLSGLKEAFDERMKKISEPYIKLAQTIRIKDKEPIVTSPDGNLNTHTTVPPSRSEATASTATSLSQPEPSTTRTIETQSESAVNSNAVHTTIQEGLHYVTIRAFNVTYRFKIRYTKAMTNPSADIVYINDDESSGYIELEINLNFPLLKCRDSDFQFLKQIENLYMLLAIGEQRGRMLSHKDGLVEPNSIRMDINQLFKELENNEDAFNELFNKG